MNQIEPQDKFPTFRRIGRKLKRVGIWLAKAALVLAVVILVVNGIMSFVFGRRLAAKIEAIKASGGIVALADFGKPKIPDSENAAVVYDKAFKLISTDQAKKDYDVNEDFLKPEERAKRPELEAQARSVVARYSGIIPIVEEAAKRPKCQYPVAWGKGFAALFPHLARIRQLVRILDANVILRAREGNTEEAVRLLKLSFAVGESLKDEPSLISLLVRVAATRMNSRALLDVVETGKLTEAQARRLYDALGDRDYGAGFERAMQCERAFGIWGFDFARKQGLRGAADLTGMQRPRIPRVLNRLLVDAWRPISYADEISYLEYMNRTVERASRPYRSPDPWQMRARTEPDLPWYAIFSKILLPVFTRARVKADEAEARVAGDRIMLALIAYKDRYGAYPANLAELRAKLGWSIEEDTFSGKDFVYRKQGAGFLLYSLGENLKDDGAGVEPKRTLPAPVSPGAPAPASPGTPPASVGQPASAPPGSPPGTSPPSAPPPGFVYMNAKGEHTADIIWELER